MSERQVLRMGDPRLYRVSAPVSEFATVELDALVADLWDSMAALGGVGIAAPQIGVGLRVVVFALEADPCDEQRPPIPRTVLVNPEIEPLSDDVAEGWEGCLSVPGMRGLVPRYTRIRYAGCDARGTRLEREATDFHARVVQHECDHLDGVLYPQRMRDLTRFGFEAEILRASSPSF